MVMKHNITGFNNPPKCTHSFTQEILIQMLIHSFTRSPSSFHLLTHLFTHSLTHPVTPAHPYSLPKLWSPLLRPAGSSASRQPDHSDKGQLVVINQQRLAQAHRSIMWRLSSVLPAQGPTNVVIYALLIHPFGGITCFWTFFPRTFSGPAGCTFVTCLLMTW